MGDVSCTRCGQTRAALDRQPFPSAIGARALQEICADCWAQWQKQQMMLINHYGLNLMDIQARQFLTKNMEAFLFKAGQQEEIDTSKQGTIQH
ncbi:MAG: oxidative damage protection protein [Gemmatimonadaceae bacterium]